MEKAFAICRVETVSIEVDMAMNRAFSAETLDDPNEGFIMRRRNNAFVYNN